MLIILLGLDHFERKITDKLICIPDGKPQWSPAKSRMPYTKENKQSHTYDSVGTSSCFGSSVHYGGRDYYGSFAPKQSSEYNDVRNC
jgi:hypothetical protein